MEEHKNPRYRAHLFCEIKHCLPRTGCSLERKTHKDTYALTCDILMGPIQVILVMVYSGEKFHRRLVYRLCVSGNSWQNIRERCKRKASTDCSIYFTAPKTDMDCWNLSGSNKDLFNNSARRIYLLWLLYVRELQNNGIIQGKHRLWDHINAVMKSDHAGWFNTAFVSSGVFFFPT